MAGYEHWYEVKNKVILITGGAIGIGASTVRAFLEQGANHVAFLDVLQDAGVALEAELQGKYGVNKAKFIKCDVSNDEELFNAYDTVIEQHGHIDVVVNNAGILNDSKDVYKKAIAVNLTALITSTLKAIDLMRKDHGGQGGTVINIASVAALVQVPMLPIYYSTKSAILQFSNCIGMEHHYSRTGVRVIAVCFGATDTSLVARPKCGGFDRETDTELAQHFSEFKYQKTESAAAAVVDAYRRGASGSTWLSDDDKRAVDITCDVKEAYSILSRGVFK